MNALDSPLDALAFDHLSFGLLTVINNVWTWVAVITAAVSVWKFRASSSPRADSSKFPDEASPVKRLAAETTAAAAAASTSTLVEAAKPSTAAGPSWTPSPCVLNGEGRTSGKFIFYYDRMEEEGEGRGDDGTGEDDDEDGNVGGQKEWFGEDWEVMMRMRMGHHMGFYRYQDLRVLDGSVVRLWDGRRCRCSPRPVNQSWWR